MGAQKLLFLADRFKPSYPSFPDPSRLIGLVCSMVGILGAVMNNLRNQLPYNSRKSSTQIKRTVWKKPDTPFIPIAISSLLVSG